ncbi:unnamed protein product [Strongylus vulgaris]|uniref:Peptidase A1 domain-containing protein n=1 Tax=Strongylus vulgaris TaxID=40348 RepID=A0A3P7J2R0_STRVU|nr:unnamed protein product [Strongylus vulgaris]
MGDYESRRGFEVIQDLRMWIRGPSIEVKRMAENIGAEYNYDSDVYEISCDAKFPDFNIFVDNKILAITYDKLIIELDGDPCVLALVPINDDVNATQWYIGAPFLRQYCTVFDVRRKRLSFAKVKPIESNTTTTPWTRRTRTRKTSTTSLSTRTT